MRPTNKLGTMIEIEEKANALIKAIGAVRLLLANGSGQLILDVGPDHQPETAATDAARLATFANDAWSGGEAILDNHVKRVQLQAGEKRMLCWNRSPFLVAAFFSSTDVKASANAGHEQLEELITSLQEELT